MNSLIGDISTVLVSRLTTHLYIGTLAPKIRWSERLKEDFLGLLFTILLSLGALIGLGYGLGIATDVELFNPFLVILLISIDIMTIFFILFVFLFLGAIFLFKRGKDPNNMLIPIVTSVADFLTPLLLIILIQIFI
jgi:cation transporter-like permease